MEQPSRPRGKPQRLRLDPRNRADGSIRLYLREAIPWRGVLRKDIELLFIDYDSFTRSDLGLAAFHLRGKSNKSRGYLLFPWSNILVMDHIYNSEAVVSAINEWDRTRQDRSINGGIPPLRGHQYLIEDPGQADDFLGQPTLMEDNNPEKGSK